MAERATAERLLAIERELAEGDGSVYARHLDEGAVVIVPGMKLDRDGTVEAMDASPGWDEWSFSGETARELADGAALLSYRFDGSRGDTTYAAHLTSVYIRDAEGEWKLAHHQHTPIGD